MIKAGQRQRETNLNSSYPERIFTGVRVSKGSGTVTLAFVPQGFIEGLIAFSLESFFLPTMETNKRTESHEP